MSQWNDPVVEIVYLILDFVSNHLPGPSLNRYWYTVARNQWHRQGRICIRRNLSPLLQQCVSFHSVPAYLYSTCRAWEFWAHQLTFQLELIQLMQQKQCESLTLSGLTADILMSCVFQCSSLTTLHLPQHIEYTKDYIPYHIDLPNLTDLSLHAFSSHTGVALSLITGAPKLQLLQANFLQAVIDTELIRAVANLAHLVAFKGCFWLDFQLERDQQLILSNALWVNQLTRLDLNLYNVPFPMNLIVLCARYILKSVWNNGVFTSFHSNATKQSMLNWLSQAPLCTSLSRLHLLDSTPDSSDVCTRTCFNCIPSLTSLELYLNDVNELHAMIPQLGTRLLQLTITCKNVSLLFDSISIFGQFTVLQSLCIKEKQQMEVHILQEWLHALLNCCGKSLRLFEFDLHAHIKPATLAQAFPNIIVRQFKIW